MEKGNIAEHHRYERACIFENLLANPPKTPKWFPSRSDADNPLKGWTANELPLKSVIDSTNRLGLPLAVITLLGVDMEDPIYRWLLKRGVACTVLAFDGLEDALEAFKYNQWFRTIYVPTEELAQIIGIRSTVVSPSAAFGAAVGLK